MWLSVLIFALACGQCFLLTKVAIAVARHIRLLDWPDKDRKLHARATPLMGGVAVFLTLLLGAGQCYATGYAGLNADPHFVKFVAILLVSAGLLCGIGLWDDKWGMRARNKFLLQVLAILPYVCWGRATSAVDLFGWHLDLAWLGIPLTLFWLVACTNFVNLVDGLDGLATSVGLIVCLTVAVLSALQQLTGILCFSLILSGALVGFLIHNWPPAKIFLGDSGSLPLGFLVGALAIEASVKKAAGLTLAVPFALLSIPMFDTSMAILRRKLNGLTIGQGDRAHIHHCLRDRGLTPTQTLLAIAGMCLATASAVVLAAVYHNELIAVVVCGAVLGLLIMRRIFGFNEVALLTRHVRAAWSFLVTVPHALRSKFLLVRLTPAVIGQRQVFWDYIVRRSKRMHAHSIRFTCSDPVTAEPVGGMTWTSGEAPDPGAPTWQLSYSIPRSDSLMATIVATGQVASDAQPHRLNELLEIFAAFCPDCPIDDQLRPSFPPDARVDQAHSGSSGPAEPHIIPGKWQASTDGKSRAGRSGKLDCDAA